MIKNSIIVLALFSSLYSNAQLNDSTGKTSMLATGFSMPVGNFTSTHYAGISAIYLRSHHRFGINDKKNKTKYGFIYGAGMTHYLGKKEGTGNTAYQYAPFTLATASVGTIMNPVNKINLLLTAGPGLGFYNGRRDFYLQAGFSASYYLSYKFAITPGILLMKKKGTDGILAIALKGCFAF